MENYYTEDIAEFGSRERAMAAELLQAQFPEGFYDDGVKVALNKESGYVFLVNSDYQVAMMNGKSLELFHSTPYSGIEGFITDILSENEPDELDPEDVDYILESASAEGAELPESWAKVAQS